MQEVHHRILLVCVFLFMGTMCFAGQGREYKEEATKGAAEQYAIEAARAAKKAYKYSRFIYQTKRKEQVSVYKERAIRFASISLLTADTAISLADPQFSTGIAYLKRTKQYNLSAIQALKKIDTKRLTNYREYSKQAFLSLADAVLSSYQSAMHIKDRPTTAPAVASVPDKLGKRHPADKKPATVPQTQTAADKGDQSHKQVSKEDTSRVGALNVPLNGAEQQLTTGQPVNEQVEESRNILLITGIAAVSILSLIAFKYIYAAKVQPASTASSSSYATPASHTINPEISSYLSNFVDVGHQGTLMLKTAEAFNIAAVAGLSTSAIVNLKRINDVREINPFFATVYKSLPAGGIFIGCVETLHQRKKRILAKFPWGAAHLYLSGDFIFKRVLPKFKISRWFYLFITAGRNQAISRAEVLGRATFSGFQIEDETEINNVHYMVLSKNGQPSAQRQASRGLFVKLKRIGKNGQPITVYKLRTMRPYAEYLQDYVYEKNNLKESGKFRNDFRIAGWGKMLRAFWIDELPMIVNVFKGQMKLVGVRPLSEQYLRLYTPELQAKRAQVKPGLVPPYYADMPKSLDEIMESEHRYLDSVQRHPVSTDIRYFCKAMVNILFKKARSG